MSQMNPYLLTLLTLFVILIFCSGFQLGFLVRALHNYEKGKRIGADKPSNVPIPYWWAFAVITLMTCLLGGIGVVLGWLLAGTNSLELGIRVGRGDAVSAKMGI